MKNAYRALFFLISFSLATFSVVSVAGQKPSVLLVGVGGYKSCIEGLHTQFIARSMGQVITDLRNRFPDIAVSQMMVCAPGIKAVKGSGKLEYYGPNTPRGGRLATSPNGLAQTIISNKPSSDSKVILVGHSHGGFYAAQAAQSIEVYALYMIEPISPNNCDTIDWLNNRPRKILKNRQHFVSGCRQAPTDWDLNQILKNTQGRLYNFILSENQDRGAVHSSSVLGATNIEKTLDRGERSHHLLGLDKDVWNDICASISVAMGATRDETFCNRTVVDEKGRFIRLEP